MPYIAGAALAASRPAAVDHGALASVHLPRRGGARLDRRAEPSPFPSSTAPKPLPTAGEPQFSSFPVHTREGKVVVGPLPSCSSENGSPFPLGSRPDEAGQTRADTTQTDKNGQKRCPKWVGPLGML